ncbi:hypothetical protein [Leminorella grimontii]|uniref:hypothetical protein n=1 Tax=Leminorella grimontii TaxID=82981 RepID=UPI00321FD5E1
MAKSDETRPVGPLETNHNRRLAELLAQVSQAVEAAESQDGLVAAIERVRAFDGPLAFNHTRPKLVACLALLAAALVGGYQYYAYRHLSAPVVILMVIFGLCAVGLFIYMWRKSSRIRALAERLYQRDLLFDNDMRELGDELPQLEKQLFSNFYEFNRGNYSRELSAGYEGRYQGATHAISYHFYHFHYVDKRTEVSTDSKGRVRTRTVYDHYDRYGIMLPFRYVSHLAIIGKSVSGLKGSDYKPSSNRFNKLFKVIADTEMTAARFLKPTVVLACEEAANGFSALNLEFNAQAQLCMSFDNRSVISGQQQHDFASPDAFIEEVRGHNALPELQRALDFIHTLMVYSDSNFRKDEE